MTENEWDLVSDLWHFPLFDEDVVLLHCRSSPLSVPLYRDLAMGLSQKDRERGIQQREHIENMCGVVMQ